MSNLIGRVCMVRTYSAGVFIGTVAERDGKEVTLTNARRIWYWDGAATLSQLATEGTSKPKNCKFPAPVAEVVLTEAIEFIPATEAAIASIAAVPVWCCSLRKPLKSLASTLAAAFTSMPMILRSGDSSTKSTSTRSLSR